MKFLCVIDSLGSGGAQRQMVTLARGLKLRGHNPEFFVYYPHDHFAELLREAEIPVHSFRKTRRFSLAVPLSLKKLVAERKYDLCLAFLETPSLYAELASCFASLKLVVSERFMYPTGRLPIRHRFLQQFHRLADHITVNSHHQRERMEQEFPWMKRKISTIYNGVDLDLFAPKKASDFVPSLLSLGTVVPKKNALGLIQALRICRDLHDVNIEIAWAGKTGDRDHKNFLQNELDKNQLSTNWNWLGECKDIPQLLSQHAAIIHPSFFEGLPNAICEGLASGRPILASDVCDHARLVENSVNGYLFDPASAESIAQALLKWHALPPEQRQAMGVASRELAQEKLSLPRFVDEYESVFVKLVSHQKER